MLLSARPGARALRLSVRGFGEHLGVAPRTVSKWEHLGEATRPHPDTQAILDTALDRAGTDAQLRFRLLLDHDALPAVVGHQRRARLGLRDLGRRP